MTIGVRDAAVQPQPMHCSMCDKNVLPEPLFLLSCGRHSICTVAFLPTIDPRTETVVHEATPGCARVVRGLCAGGNSI